MSQDPKEGDPISHVSAAQAASNSEHMSDIMLFAIAYKTGRIPLSTTLDFAKLSIQKYRDQIVTAAFCSCISMIGDEFEFTSEVKRHLTCMLEAVQQHMEKSNNPYKNLFEHMREEHEEELKNELHRLGGDYFATNRPD